MKTCPYCAELIGSNSKKCKYCGETISAKKTTTSRSIKQNPAVIKTAIFIVLSRSIIAFLIRLASNDYSVILALLLDTFFSINLFKMREWARKWTIGFTIFRMAYFTVLYFSKANFFGWIIEIFILSIVLILLIGLGSKKKAIIATFVYAIFITGLIWLYFLGITAGKETQNIIENISFIKEQSSKEGFKVILPSDNWRFLKKHDIPKILGEDIQDVSIVITDLKGEVYGTFGGSEISLQGVKQDTIDEILDSFIKESEKELTPGYEVTAKIKDKRSAIVESKYLSYGSENISMHGCKLLDDTYISFQFWGTLSSYNSCKGQINNIISNIQEISRKQFLPQLSSKDIYNKNTDGVVLVRLYDKSGQIIGFASGFNIREDGLVVTNLHSILAGYYIDIKFPYHGSYEEVYIAALSKTLNDLVVLKITGKGLPAVNIDDAMEIEIGDKVVVISNPEGLLNSLSEGVISGLRHIEEYPYYQMTAPISGGSSGGAVFNQYGNIIGISTGSLERGQNLNFCIPITEIGNMEVFEQYITLPQFQEFLKEEAKKKKKEWWQ